MLKPLPAIPYELHHRLTLTVQRNGYIRLLGHYYSVPHTYSRKKVTVFYTSQTVEVYQYYKLISRHQRSYAGFGYTTDKEHLPKGQQVVFEDDPSPYLKKAEQIDATLKTYLERVIEQKKLLAQGCKSCRGILSFADRVGTDRLIAACKYAAALKLYNYQIINETLKRGPDHIGNMDMNEPSATPSHENIRGREYYN